MNVLSVKSLVIKVSFGIYGFSCNPGKLSVDVEGERAEFLNVDTFSLSEVVAQVLNH